MAAAPTAEQLRADLRTARLENRIQRERLEADRLKVAGRHQDRRRRLMESLSLDWVTPYAELLDRFRATGDPILTGPSSFWQRKRGRNWPIYQTEQELNILRAPARLLVATNSYAQGLLSGLTSYVIGPGYTYRAAKKRWDGDAPKELVAAVQAVVDQVLRDNQWYGGEQPGLEEELFGRSVEDGEFFLASYPAEDGRTWFRTVEPEQVTAPPADGLEPDEDGWFGVITPADDAQRPLGYWVYWGDSPADGERLDPDRVTHLRRNVRRSMKRGIPDFTFDAYDALDLAQKLRTNLADGAAQQAAIVGVRQHATGTQSDIEAFADAQTEFTRTDPLSQTQERIRRFRRGSWEDVPEGLQYVDGPGAHTGAPAHLQVLSACLRSAGVKWNAPEWLPSADASNNNYASSLTAESPFVRSVVRGQRAYREAFRRPVWAAVEHWVRCRGLRAAGRSWTWEEIAAELDLLVEAPSPETRNKLQEAQQAQIEIPLGVDSRQQYAQRSGRDWDQVEADNQTWEDEHGGDAGPLPLPGDPPGGGGGGADPFSPPGLESATDDAIGRALLEDKFTGTIVDAAGRKRRYVDGRQVAAAPAGGGGHGDAKPTDAKPDEGGGDAKPAPTSAVGRAVARVKAVGSAVMATKVGRVVQAAEHKLAFLAHKTREIAAEAARRRRPPLDEAGVKRLTKVLAIADFIGGSVAGGVIATVNPIAGKITSASLPTVSVLYVAYSAVRDPAGTWAAARQVARDTLAGKAHHHESLESVAPELADRLADFFGGGDPDWREAVLLAALAETGDLAKALDVAERAGPMPAQLPAATAEDFGGEPTEE